jgi:hypothetical protein
MRGSSSSPVRAVWSDQSKVIAWRSLPDRRPLPVPVPVPSTTRAPTGTPGATGSSFSSCASLPCGRRRLGIRPRKRCGCRHRDSAAALSPLVTAPRSRGVPGRARIDRTRTRAYVGTTMSPPHPRPPLGGGREVFVDHSPLELHGSAGARFRSLLRH